MSRRKSRNRRSRRRDKAGAADEHTPAGSDSPKRGEDQQGESVSAPLAASHSGPFLSRLSDGAQRILREPETVIAGFSLLCLGLMAGQLVDLSGHDYGYFLPKLIDNQLFYLNNGWGWQEYTAGYCAGIFNFANPQSMSLALPQLLAYLFGPLRGVQGTFLVISLLSGGGIYFCARHWGLERIPACIAAVAVVFNGFLLTRMAIGHLAFYGFGFGPAVAACLLYGIKAMGEGKMVRAGVFGAGAALLLAVLIYGGIGVLLVHTGAAVVLILLICGGFDRGWLKAGVYCLLCVVAGLAAAAPKIEAVLAMNANLSRDFYPLPGFSPPYLPLALFQSLLGVPNEEAMNGWLRNGQFYQGWQELYYGFTPLLGVGMAGALLLTWRQSGFKGWKPLSFRAGWERRPLVISFIAGVLLLAVALNLYQPGWNGFLKSLPILGQFSGMTRFLALFIPALALLLGWTVNHWNWKRIPLAAVLVFIGVLALYQHQIIDEHLRPGMYYDRLDQDGRLGRDSLLAAWPAEAEAVPPVSAVAIRTERQPDGTNRAVPAPYDDGKIIQGESNALCYEPLFGYRLEQYPFKALRIGDIRAVDGAGNLNLKNPACYVYPEANGCEPGDHFKASQLDAMNALVNYGDPMLAVSERRRLADTIGVTTLLLLIGYLMGCGGYRAYRAYRRLAKPTGDTR